MKLLLQRNQADKGIIGTSMVFSLTARVELTDEEDKNVHKYKMENSLLYSNLEERGKGIIGWLSRKAVGTEITVNNLIEGTKINCKDISEMIEVHEQVKEACNSFKQILDTAALFGGEEVIEL